MKSHTALDAVPIEGLKIVLNYRGEFMPEMWILKALNSAECHRNDKFALSCALSLSLSLLFFLRLYNLLVLMEIIQVCFINKLRKLEKLKKIAGEHSSLCSVFFTSKKIFIFIHLS